MLLTYQSVCFHKYTEKDLAFPSWRNNFHGCRGSRHTLMFSHYKEAIYVCWNSVHCFQHWHVHLAIDSHGMWSTIPPILSMQN